MSIGEELDRVLADAEPQPAWWRRRWIWIFAAIVVAAGGYVLLSGGGESSSGESSAVVTTTVIYRSIGDTVAASGKLLPVQVVDVGAQVSGQMQRLHVQAGDPVSKGDVVAEIDATIQASVVAAERSRLEALQARLPSVESRIALAEAGLARERRLMESQATYQVALDQAENTLITARSNFIELQSEIESQKALVATEQAKLSYSTIEAPASGVVVAVHVTEGQTLNASQVAPVILQIADLSRMVVEAQVAEANIGKLAVGAGVSFTTLGGGARRWRGVLQRIIPSASENSNVVSYTAIFEVDNADGALLPGMTAQVFFELSRPREVLTVPVDMLGEFGETAPGGGRTAQIALVNNAGGMELRRVVVGEIGATYAEVLEGLEEGDRVASQAALVEAAE
ncbi:efflux RND transporter periplasmic adaptor subunit [Candidatus Foliamicus sp.]